MPENGGPIARIATQRTTTTPTRSTTWMKPVLPREQASSRSQIHILSERDAGTTPRATTTDDPVGRLDRRPTGRPTGVNNTMEVEAAMEDPIDPAATAAMEDILGRTSRPPGRPIEACDKGAEAEAMAAVIIHLVGDLVASAAILRTATKSGLNHRHVVQQGPIPNMASTGLPHTA